ncbi:MAG: hypothetical protein KGL39_55185 [Patescibacteria group bacterium]|nr:hypothetical protein [Patescibacteria group bacterium]
MTDREIEAADATELTRLRESNAELARDNARLKDELKLHRDKAADCYWCWAGDGSDYPDSLTCPVLMHAEDLRALLRRGESNARLLAALKECEDALIVAAPQYAGTIRKARAAIASVESQ